jgi:hypothetical protein
VNASNGALARHKLAIHDVDAAGWEALKLKIAN